MKLLRLNRLFHFDSRNEKAVRRRINELGNHLLEAKEHAQEDVQSESIAIAQLKDDLLESRRATRGEEEFVEELETVREAERTKTMDKEEIALAKKRDRFNWIKTLYGLELT